MIDFEYDPAKKQFQWIFISFDACIKAYRFCRPMVYLDATFLTGRFRGCLMEATGINGDKGFFPLAVALANAENNNSWEWFLRNLTQLVGEGRPITFLSDHHEGLLHGIPLFFPDSYHSYCYYHLKNNLPITDSDPRYTLVVGIDAQLVGESFNSWILVHRKMHASALLDQIRMKIMVILAGRRDDGSKMMILLTPEYEERLEYLQDEFLAWKVLVANPTVFEVFSERTHRVDLEHWTCTCQRCNY
ncbi:uncharacterized protein LOC113305991 [Papaver somniferum]|uniref:uncharacterized protein LOC113305991 n=1 Tax=Papaver somniferum TaxID=3469 RepID=UPI000E6F50A8|nr:uncharacterized protein LOC113305991 [Papaver somniferum]